MTFNGIPAEALDFYEGLEADNTKTYWTEHKELYETAVRAPVVALGEVLGPRFGPVHLFRPYRDVRFSGNKNPYKEQQGVTVGDFYFHISAEGLFAATGFYQMAPDQIARYRETVVDDVIGPDLEAVVTRIRKRGYTVGGDILKTHPRGYPADHPRIELLRHRSLVASISFGAPDWMHTADVATHLELAWQEMAPLQNWLSAQVGPSRRGPRPRDPVGS